VGLESFIDIPKKKSAKVKKSKRSKGTKKKKKSSKKTVKKKSNKGSKKKSSKKTVKKEPQKEEVKKELTDEEKKEMASSIKKTFNKTVQGEYNYRYDYSINEYVRELHTFFLYNRGFHNRVGPSNLEILNLYMMLHDKPPYDGLRKYLNEVKERWDELIEVEYEGEICYKYPPLLEEESS
jgi:hypothetical protein